MSVSQPELRLVGSRLTPEFAAWEQSQRSRNAVVKENRLAAHGPLLEPHDSILKLATETRLELQGPVLTPERRTKLLKLANRIGVRPFDASLVIAIEQDRARREAVNNEVVEAPEEVELQIPNVGRPFLWRWFLATLGSMVAAILLIRWLGLG